MDLGSVSPMLKRMEKKGPRRARPRSQRRAPGRHRAVSQRPRAARAHQADARRVLLLPERSGRRTRRSQRSSAPLHGAGRSHRSPAGWWRPSGSQLRWQCRPRAPPLRRTRPLVCPAARAAASSSRSSTRRILPEMVFGSSANSSRRTRLYGASRSRAEREDRRGRRPRSGRCPAAQRDEGLRAPRAAADRGSAPPRLRPPPRARSARSPARTG